MASARALRWRGCGWIWAGLRMRAYIIPASVNLLPIYGAPFVSKLVGRLIGRSMEESID